MGIFDKAKEAADKASELAEEHGDKLPGDLGDKAKDAAEKVTDLKDKLPGR